jgi:hypothetical protein
MVFPEIATKEIKKKWGSVIIVAAFSSFISII